MGKLIPISYHRLLLGLPAHHLSHSKFHVLYSPCFEVQLTVGLVSFVIKDQKRDIKKLLLNSP